MISPGEPLMEIVPRGERLVIQAQVEPADIDSVHPGLIAQVRLTAFNRRSAPPIEGEVVSISADRLTDPRTGQPYYLARIKLPEDPLRGMEGMELYPGMQAEVMIVTALDYLLRPVTRSFDRALREE